MNQDQAVQLSIDNIEKYGLTDITKEKVEVNLITQFKADFIANVKSKLSKGNIYDMGFKPVQHLLTPKNRYVFDYRKAALIDPSCLTKFTSLVLMIAEDIEKHRIPESENRIFSYRFKPNGPDLFDQNVNYNKWREQIKTNARLSNCTYIVQCDIAAFYDRINIHRVESTLLSLSVDKGITKKINDLLLFWSKKDSYGIPVGNAASRILAEAALIDIDKYLVSESINFIRYVDDFRIFAPDLATAHKWMNKLTNRLFRDGLMLNTGKTNLYLAKKNIEDQEDGKPIGEAEAVIKIVTKLTGGYSRIVKKFMMPATDKLDPFKKIDLGKEIQTLSGNEIVDFIGIQKILIACLVQQQFNRLLHIITACKKYFYALDYIVDMLLKNKQYIPIPIKNQIADKFSDYIMNSEFYSLEWYEASIARLLSDDDYFRKQALFHIIRNSTKEVSTYPSMMALEGLFDKITRTEFRTIREWYEKCDDWEKRRVNYLSSALPDDERKAWCKAVKSTIQHDFLSFKYVDSII
jgi:hypothetical protein